MVDPIQVEKEKLRKTIATLLRHQKEEARLKKSRGILKELFALPQFRRAKTVLFYASFDGEVNTLDMIEQSLTLGKKVALPITQTKNKEIIPAYVDHFPKDVAPGPYGILQPSFAKARVARIEDIDLSIVPGIAFDHSNYRLGRGAGYYDRFLSRLPSSTFTIGLAFDFQIVPRLPHHEHDMPLGKVIAQ